MKILIYTGYHTNKLSKGRYLDEGVGGTEYCAIKLAEQLVKKGHIVTFSGYVENEVVDGVHYIHLEDLQRYQSPIALNEDNKLRSYAHYDVVIAQQYIHYFRELSRKRITFDKSLFWLHNEDTWYGWFRGKMMRNNGREYLYRADMNGVVGVSKYHEDILKDNFKALGSTTRDFNTYIHSIDNAIDPSDWDNQHYDKIPGRIIWSSSPDRGLDLILENWAYWKSLVPELSLVAACPPYSKDWSRGDVNQEGIEWVGNLSPSRLREEQLKAEYWIYSSNYKETYCITALEVMMAKCKIITNGTGNIINLMDGGKNGTIVDDNPDEIISSIIADRNDKTVAYKNRTKLQNARQFARNQNWVKRVNDWLNLIESV